MVRTPLRAPGALFSLSLRMLQWDRQDAAESVCVTARFEVIL
jgi:hypothetical protein